MIMFSTCQCKNQLQTSVYLTFFYIPSSESQNYSRLRYDLPFPRKYMESCPRSQSETKVEAGVLSHFLSTLTHSQRSPFPFKLRQAQQSHSQIQNIYFVWMLFSRLYLTKLSAYFPWGHYKSSTVPLPLPVPHSTPALIILGGNGRLLLTTSAVDAGPTPQSPLPEFSFSNQNVITLTALL